MDYVLLRNTNIDEASKLFQEWIKLYPSSFHRDTPFTFHDCGKNRVVIVLDNCISSLATCLLVNYLAYQFRDTESTAEAYITIDDFEILPSSKDGKRARIFIDKETENFDRISILLNDNTLFVYNYKRKAFLDPQTDTFAEPQLNFIDDGLCIKVGDILPPDDKKTNDTLSPNAIKWYIILGLVGLLIGFAIVYFSAPETLS